MVLAPINSPIAIGVGALVGNSMTSNIASSINNMLNNGRSVIFSEDSPVIQGYQAFKNNVLLPVQQSIVKIKDALTVASAPVNYIAITDRSQLQQHVPLTMQNAILSYAPIKKLFIESKIYGFGQSVSDLDHGPDRWERIINNGSTMSGDTSEYIETVHMSGDPDYVADDIDKVIDTRSFIDEFLVEEILNGEHGDFTDYPNMQYM